MGATPVTFDPSTFQPLPGQPNPASTLQGAVAYGAQQDPVRYAKHLSLLKQLGIPSAVGADNDQQMKPAADVNAIDYPAFAAANPRTTAWASNPDNAAVSGVDEIHRLAGMEQNAAGMRATVSAYTPSLWENAKQKIADAYDAMTGTRYTFDDLKNTFYQNPLARLGIDTFAGAAGTVGDIGSRGGWHGDGPTKENILQRVESGISDELKPQSPYAMYSGGQFDWVGKNVGPMIPAMLLSGGTSLVARTLGLSDKATRVLAGLSVGAMFTAAQSGKTYTQVAGAGGSDYAALLAANRVAAINAPVNALFGATEVVPFLRDNPYLTSLGIGGLTGAAGQVSQNVVTGQPTMQGVPSSVLQGAATQFGLHLGSEAFFGNLSQAIDATAESKLRERSPEAFTEAQQAIYQGDPSFRIPVDRFNEYFQGQKIDPQAVAGKIGAANYGEAVMSGGDVEVPRASFFSQLEPEHQKGLGQDVVDPASGMTARQHQEGRDELQQWMTGGGPEKLQAEAAQMDAETATSPEWQGVKETLRQRYVDAGEAPEVADTLATKDANAYSNLARNAGMKADELLRMYNPRVVAGDADTGVLYQNAPRIDYGAELEKKIAADPAAAEAEYSSLPDTKGGRVLNTDDARELSEHYREDRTRSADVHEPASQFIKDLYAKKLAAPVGEGREPLVLFTAGGTGAGKSTSLRTEGGAPLESAADIIYDTNMNTFESADKKIQQALDSGRSVAVQYTYRDPVEAMTGGMLPRAMRMGRTVPLDDHLRTHVGARKVIDQLQEKYADDPRVGISAVDNSHGKNNSRDVALDALPQIEENGLRERLQNALEAEHTAGRISDKVRAGVEAFRREGVVEGVREGSGGHDQPERHAGPLDGRTTTLLTPSGKIPAQYALVEAANLVPSHDPHTFAVNPNYPPGVQERAYDTSKEAQARVIDQAQNYEPAYTVNSNPDAVNGPPVVTPGGIVLGGNSRAMSTQRLYADGRGDVYRDALSRQAAEFGLTPEAVAGMKEPVLVRRVDAPGDTDSLRRLGTDLNRSMTGALGAAEKAVSAGKNIKPETLRTVSGMLNEGDYTLRELLAAQGPRLVQMMVGDGVITGRERPQYVDPSTGGLNEAGKSFVEKALLGSVIDDPRLMEDAPKSVVAKLERSLGPITSFSARADEWNILPAIREAVGELGAIQRAGSSVDLWTGQTSMFGEERNPLVDAMVRALDQKPNDVREAFDTYSRDADANLPGQSRMFGEASAIDAFNHAFGSKLTEQEFHNGLDRAGTERAAAADPGSDGDVPEASARSEGASGAEPAGTTAGQPRGWFRVLPDGTYEIGKTKIGDLSTFVHEPAHAYLKILGDLAKRDGASDILKEDYGKTLDFLGAKDGEALTREQQEMWARANEQYLREGKAPSPGLRGVFQRFAVWLGSVYKKASDLGVELNDDIRGVFDRLYAAEEGVDRAEAENGPRMFSNAEEAGWTEEQFKEYADANHVSVEQAKSQILGMLNEAKLRSETDAWRDEERNVREAMTAKIDQSPEYAAMRALRKGRLDDGTELTMNRDELVKQFGEERVKDLQRQHPNLYRNEGGIEPETAAEILGFPSADSMVNALENAPKRAVAIEQATREYMTAKHGDIRYDGSLQDQARIALENDKRAQALHSELTALKKKQAAAEAQAAGQKAAMRSISVAPIDAYREAARQMVETKAVADLQPTRYLDASRKYSREAFDALRKGDAQAAADAKHKELMNHFLFREATKAKEYVGKFESYVKRMSTKGPQSKLGLAGGDYRDQFNRILGRYGMGPSVQTERTLADWAAAQYEAGKEPAIDPAILNEARTVNYRNAPVSEIRAVHDALVNVRKLASLELGMEVNGQRIEFNAATENMSAAAHENLGTKPTRVLTNNRTFGERFGDKVQRGDALLMRTERLMEWLDGGKTGPWHDNLWNLAADSQGREYTLQEQVTKALGDALENMPKDQRERMLDKVTVPGIPEIVTRHDLVSMAFNMGNEGNLDRLQKTFYAHGWEAEAIPAIQQMLTREEWQFVQAGWDALKPLGRAQAELERRLTGLPPVMVKPMPLRIRLADGADVNLDGGYYPVVMDPRFSARGATQDAGATAQNLMEAGYGRAVTSRGNMKERTGFGGPLQLDYEQVLTQHTAKVIKDITHREFMLVANKLLLDPQIRQTLRGTLGDGYEEQMMPWLRTIVNDRNGSTVQGLGDFSRMMRGLRSNLTLAALSYKVSTSLLQWTHAPRMLLSTNPASYAKSIIAFMASPAEMTRQIKELSPNEMASRGDNLDRDVRAALRGDDGQFYKSVAKAGNLSIKYTDHVLSFPLWHSVYQDALKEHVDLPVDRAQYLAVHAADSAVRLGLGSSAPKDLPPIMRNNDLSKMLTMFYSFHNGIYGQVRDIGHQFSQDGNVGKLTYGLALSVLVPSVLSALVTGNGPKDGENLGLWAAKRALLFGADTIPLLRDAASAFDGDGEVKMTPLANVFSKATKTTQQALSGKDEKDWTGIGLNYLEVGADLAGVPGTTQAMKPLRYLHRVHQGDVADPNAWDAFVGSAHR